MGPRDRQRAPAEADVNWVSFADLAQLRPTVSGGTLHRHVDGMDPHVLSWQGHLTYLPHVAAWVAWTITHRIKDPDDIGMRCLLTPQPTLSSLALQQLNSAAFSLERAEAMRRWRPLAGEWSGGVSPQELAQSQAFMAATFKLAR